MEKEQPTIKTEFFERKNAPEVIGPDSQARTTWEFKCENEFSYDIEEKQAVESGFIVRLRIKRGRIKLTLPITVQLPESPSEHLKEHEAGHVEICKRVYADAGEAARAAAVTVLSRPYSGQGKTLDEACSKALRIASYELSSQYAEKISSKANAVSEFYDFLQNEDGAVPSDSVKRSFARMEFGHSRKLTEQ